MNPFDDIDGIRIRALRAVWKPDGDAILRRITRWYSEKFHTPLHTVEDLPLEDVLQHWFEVSYGDMEPTEWHDLAVELLETPEERAARKMADQSSDEAFMRMTQEAAESRTKKSAKHQMEAAKAILNGLKGAVRSKPMKEATLPSPKIAKEEELVIDYTDVPFDMDADPAAPPKKS